MSQQPKTETDRLANVIQVLQLGQKTGRLVVERSEGPQFEQGIITFVNGQVIQASANQQQGPNVLDWLRGWGAGRFTFTSEQRLGTTGRMPALPPHTPPWGGSGYPTPTPTSPPPTTSPGPPSPPQNTSPQTTR